MIEYLLPPNQSQSQYLGLNFSISANQFLSELHLHLGLSLIIGLFLKPIQSLSLNPTQSLSQTDSIPLSQIDQLFVFTKFSQLGFRCRFLCFVFKGRRSP